MLKDKVAVVTGGADGIGRKIALELADVGTKIAIIDINLDKARQTSEEIIKAGGTAIAVKVDITQREEVEAGFQEVLSALGQIDILVNNAGFFRLSNEFKNLQEHEWLNMFNINVHGTLRCCRAVLPHMEGRQTGKIINIASIAGVAGIAKMAIYSASKGAVISFSKALAMEVGKHNITVNCISPGQLKSYGEDADRGTYLKRSGDLGTETAHMVRFLASSDGDYITGANYIIDGGRVHGSKKSMSMKKIKIGQIGICHEHAQGKIISLRRMPEIFEIVGVVDEHYTSTTPRFAGGNLEPYEGLKFMSEEELLNIPGLQAVAVEVPNLELVSTAMRCMERNLAMHMDKPGGDNLEQFARLRRGIEERNLPFQMGYMFRGNPAIQWCIKAIHQGWLGDILEVQASMSHNYGGEEYQDYIGKFPGGIMFNLGCHLIDMVVAMLGAPTRVIPFLKSVSGYPDHIKNNCLTIFEYPHATVTLRACSKEVDGLNRRLLKICGTKGSVELCPLERFDGQPLTMRLTLKDGNEEYEAGTHTMNFGLVADRYESQLLELAKTINGEMQNPYNYEHDYLVQKLLLAASGYSQWKE